MMYNNFFNPMQRGNNYNRNNNSNMTGNNPSNMTGNNSGNNSNRGESPNQASSKNSYQNSNQTNRNYNNQPSDQNKYQDNYQSNNKSNYQPDNLDFLHNQRLSGIDPVKLKIIMEIREKSKNKSIEELLPEIMKINQELNRRNMNFSKDETSVLMDVIEESLSPAERQRFNMLKGFMGNY